MRRVFIKISAICLSCTFLFVLSPIKAKAVEKGVAGIAISLDKAFELEEQTNDIIALSKKGIIPGLGNIVVANVEGHLNIRNEPGDGKKIIGKLPKNGGGTILEDNGDGWIKLKSGKVTGYVSSEFTLTGDEANKIAQSEAKLVAIANTDGLYVREEPSVESTILTQMAAGEELLVEDGLVVSYGEDYNKWIKVSIDNEEMGYIAKDFADLSYELPKASSVEEIQYGKGVSSTRVQLVSNAKRHLGGRYVWGGTRLGSGVDCSGYVQALYRQIGISIPRSSGAQAHGGKNIKSSDLKIGDLVFYGSSSRSINHVAMYIGNGQVIHASNKRSGIKISNMRYRTPVRYARYINN